MWIPLSLSKENTVTARNWFEYSSRGGSHLQIGCGVLGLSTDQVTMIFVTISVKRMVISDVVEEAYDSVQLFLAMMHICDINWRSSDRMQVITRKWCENNDCSGVQWPSQWKRARLHAVVVQQPCDNSRLPWCLLDCHLKMWELLWMIIWSAWFWTTDDTAQLSWWSP